MQFYKVDKNGLGDFGKISIKKIVKGATSTVRAVAKPVAKVGRIVAKPVAKVGIIAARPITKVGKIVAKPVVRIAKSPMAKIAASILSPAAALVAIPSLVVDVKSAQRQAANAASQMQEPDGPPVRIYLPDGSEAEIPSNYIVNGTYTENGVVWSTKPPKMVKIYSPYGETAEISEGLLVNGRYKDQAGNIWSTNYFAPSVSVAPTDVAQKVADSLTPTPVVDGPLVKVYSPDGMEGEIPSNYVVNGQYTEDGVTWTTTPPSTALQVQATPALPEPVASMVPAGMMVTPPAGTSVPDMIATSLQHQQELVPQEEVEYVTVYAPDGTEAEIARNELINGAYVEDGIVWSTTPPKNLQEQYQEDQDMNQDMNETGLTVWERIVSALSEYGPEKNLRGFGETEDETLSLIDRLTKQVQKGKAYATAGRKLVTAVKGKKSAPAPAVEVPERAASTGIPPAFVYGAAAVGVAGLGYALIKRIKSRKR